MMNMLRFSPHDFQIQEEEIITLIGCFRLLLNAFSLQGD